MYSVCSTCNFKNAGGLKVKGGPREEEWEYYQ